MDANKQRGWSLSKLPWLILSLIIISGFLIFIFYPTNSTTFLYTNTSIFNYPIPHRILANFPTKKQSNLQKIEAGLAQARAAIKKAASMARNQSIEDPDYVPSGSVYWNPNSFHR